MLTDAFFPSGLLDSVAALQGAAYDRTCTLQRNAPTVNSDGEEVDDFNPVTYASGVPCSVKDVSLSEALRAGQMSAQSLCTVRMDVSADFTPTAADRLVLDDGAVLSIESVEDVHRAGRWWHLTCEEVR